LKKKEGHKLTVGRIFTLLTVLLIIFISLFLIGYRIFPLKYTYEISKSARENSVDPYLIAAMIKQESNYDKKAVSYAGAFGLMQLMPDTGNWLRNLAGISGSWMTVENNIFLGSYYVNYLREMFGEDEALILTAYSRGPGIVNKMLEDNEFIENTYSKRVKLFREIYRILYAGYLD